MERFDFFVILKRTSLKSALFTFYQSVMENLAEILEKVDQQAGFTVLISGKRLCRYVVAFTHNKERSLQLLESQIKFYRKSFENITIG